MAFSNEKTVEITKVETLKNISELLDNNSKIFENKNFVFKMKGLKHDTKFIVSKNEKNELIFEDELYKDDDTDLLRLIFTKNLDSYKCFE